MEQKSRYFPITMRSKTPVSKKSLAKFQRNRTPRLKKILDKDNKSKSPLKKIESNSRTDDFYKRELKNYHKKEINYIKKKNELVQEHFNTKTLLFRTEGKIKKETAKIESEREKIFELLKDLILQNKVVINLPQGFAPSVQTNISNLSSRYMKSQKKSKEEEDTNDEDVEEFNLTLKQSLDQHKNFLPSSLRALLRAYEDEGHD